MKRDIISVMDMKDDFEDILANALKMKKEPKKGPKQNVLRGKVLGMVFEKPSLRTRISFEVGMTQLGGTALYIGPDEVSIGKRESVSDVANVLSRYVNAIMYRAFSNQTMRELAKHASVPVVNGLDDLEHPCQCAGDLLTVLEKKGKLKGLQLVYVGDGNNVCNSLLLGCALTGMNMRAATPKDFKPNAAILLKAQEIAKEKGGRIETLSNPYQAVEGADVIYTDTWVSMGQETEKQTREKLFLPYQVNDKLAEKANKNYLFLHCLPAHRGLEVSAEVIDGQHSVVFDEAENRMHAQKAILVAVLGK
ncbi:MAG: ornithine carbamoyltransferase [Candidatus Thermoplasmatota archaeon]|nr:ornithine carbamoyltransferase [Candidatus Thermoplasmatota archaeon]